MGSSLERRRISQSVSYDPIRLCHMSSPFAANLPATAQSQFFLHGSSHALYMQYQKGQPGAIPKALNRACAIS
jgi:hypothetical protein